MIDIEAYKRFIGTTLFPQFTIEYFEPDLNRRYTSVAQSVFDSKTRMHVLRLPSRYETPRFLLYHELTHIYDMEVSQNGDKIHDFCLAGYMEYHASQVELMALMDAKDLDEKISFSMSNCTNYLGWTVQRYLDNKLTSASDLVGEKNQQSRILGLDVFFNFLGLKSICGMYATDFSDTFNYQPFAEVLPSLLLYEIRRDMEGWIEDVEKIVVLYSRALRFIT